MTTLGWHQTAHVPLNLQRLIQFQICRGKTVHLIFKTIFYICQMHFFLEIDADFRMLCPSPFRQSQEALRCFSK